VRRAFVEGDRDEQDADKPLFTHRRRRWMSFALHQAGLQLKAALFDKRDADESEQRRIAEILERAADEVRRR
jgi:hypothetical protein